MVLHDIPWNIIQCRHVNISNIYRELPSRWAEELDLFLLVNSNAKNSIYNLLYVIAEN